MSDISAVPLSVPISGFRSWLSGVIRDAQRGRMISVMYQMDDRTLESIGVARKDITEYVDGLLSE